MQFYESPKTYSSKDILDSIITLSKRADFIHEVRVIGGEPFLNKDIYEIINQISLIDNIHKIVIYTNGMIPPKEEGLKNFNKNKILFSITDYAELGKNLDKTVSILDKYSMPYRVHPPEHWTDSGKILEKPWAILEAKNLFAKCCGKNLYTLIGDNLYRCPFAANADQLNAIPKHVSNSVSVLSSSETIKNFAYGIDYIDACKLCPGRSFDSPIIKPAVQVKKAIAYKKFPTVQVEG
jgi:sulfatase maturation enzyme AslB (radical SAM superfamily)